VVIPPDLFEEQQQVCETVFIVYSKTTTIIRAADKVPSVISGSGL
jgi:hypothetical protein